MGAEALQISMITTSSVDAHGRNPGVAARVPHRLRYRRMTRRTNREQYVPLYPGEQLGLVFTAEYGLVDEASRSPRPATRHRARGHRCLVCARSARHRLRSLRTRVRLRVWHGLHQLRA